MGKKQKLQDEEKSEVSMKKRRPNYFIGIRVFNPEILGKIYAVQEFIKTVYPQLKKAVVPISTTHVTLAVFHLSEADVVSVQSKLEDHRNEILEIVGTDGLKMSIEGLGDFRKETLFAKITSADGLRKLSNLADFMEKICDEFCDAEQKAFKPHVTIMKLSKIYGQRKKKMRKIPPYLYECFVDLHFGWQATSSLELLSMLKKKADDGYYHSEHTIKFHDEKTEDLMNEKLSLQKWAHCIAVSCLTLALRTKSVNFLDHFSAYYANLILQDVMRFHKGKQRKRKRNLDTFQVSVEEDGLDLNPP